MGDWLHPAPSVRLTCDNAPPSREAIGQRLLDHAKLIECYGLLFLLPDAALPRALSRLVEMHAESAALEPERGNGQ